MFYSFEKWIFVVALSLLAPSFAAGGDASVPSLESRIKELWDSGRKNEAERLLKKWMKKEEASPWPWVQASKLAHAEGRYKKARGAAEEALSKDMNCAEAYYWKGRSLEALKKPLDAANEYRAALLLQKDHPQAQEALDRVMVSLGAEAALTE